MKIRCGFEWYVQIDSGKLFCGCRPIIHEEERSDSKISRVLTPSFGESGRIDISAAFEGKTPKNVLYEVFNDTDCLVDLDEEPPHDIDSGALEVALQMCSAMGCTVFDPLIFMRKVIVDGSNTSGFQRTALVGIEGGFSANDKKVSIESISLEEDSARIAAPKDGKTTYRIDRLGIPLVEIATGIIETDEKEAKEIAMAFGRLTRLFNVRRGIGTIRQDVNLSIEGGSRVELKGFQNIREMDKVITNEAVRQSSLLKLSSDKKYLLESLDRIEGKDLTGLFNVTDSDIIKRAVSSGKILLGFRLDGFSGVFGTELSENKRFGTEVSDYLRVNDMSGIIHSDELPAYGISDKEKKAVYDALGCSEEDAFLFSICLPEQEGSIAESLKTRIRDLLKGVPSEVRTVEKDNSTRFLRPIGGRDRMYVETDLPVIAIDKKVMERSKAYSGFSAESLMKEYNINENTLDLLISTKKLGRALELNRENKVHFNVLTGVMVDDYRYIKRKFGFDLKDEQIESVLIKIASGEIAKDASRFIFEKLATGGGNSVDGIISAYSLRKKTKKELTSEIKKLVSSINFSRYDTLITNLRDRLGFSFDAGEAYAIAMGLLEKK